MSYESKPLDPPEKSLKYIAWSVKEMSAEFKKLTALFEKFIEQQNRPAPKEVQGELPF